MNPWVALLGASTALAAQESDLSWATVDGGGGRSANGFFALEATLGQPDAGVMSDGFYQIESGFWSASVESAPFVSVDPPSALVAFGDDLVLRADTGGTGPFRYQWRLNGVNLAGETNAALMLGNISLRDLGAYSVVVVNERGVTKSESSRVTPNLPSLMSQDDFGNRSVIPLSTMQFIGNNVGFTLELDEPLHAGKLGGSSAWYTWTAPSSGIATFQTTGGTFDTLLGIYVGKTLDSLAPIAGDDDRGGFLTSQVRFNAEGGATYHIAVDGVGGRSGPYVVTWELEVTDEELPVITVDPPGRAVVLGSATVFTVEATGFGLSYQWTFNGVDIPGSHSSSLMIPNVQMGDVGHYVARVSNSDGRTVESQPASLEIGNVATAISHNKFEDLALALGLTIGGAPLTSLTGTSANLNATPGVIPVSVGPIQQQGYDNETALNDQPCSTECGEVGGAAQWVALRPDMDGVMRLDTVGSEFDTVLYVFEAALDICDFPVACDSDSAEDGVSSSISFAVRGGRTYIVVVDGENGEQGDIVLNYRLCQPSAPFVRQPEGLYLVAPVNPLPFPENPDYRWRRDGLEFEQTSEPVLFLGEAPGTAVSYDVVFTSADGGEIQVVTNRLGFMVRAQYAFEVDKDGPVFRMVLPGVNVQPFQLERADTTLMDCDNSWVWLPETNYSAAIIEKTMVLNIPMSQPVRFYRVRPLPPDDDSP